MADDVVDDGGGSKGVPCNLCNGKGRRAELLINGNKKEVGDGDIRGYPFRLYIEGFTAALALEAGLVEGDEASGKSSRKVPDGLGGAGIFFDAVGSAAGRADVFVPYRIRSGDEDLNGTFVFDAFFDFCTIRDHGEGVDDVPV